MLSCDAGVGATAWTPESATMCPVLIFASVGRSTRRVGTSRQSDATVRRWAYQSHRPGAGGILGAYAALFEPSIREVVALVAPASHAEGPAFLNVLRVLDVPEALGLRR